LRLRPLAVRKTATKDGQGSQAGASDNGLTATCGLTATLGFGHKCFRQHDGKYFPGFLPGLCGTLKHQQAEHFSRFEELSQTCTKAMLEKVDPSFGALAKGRVNLEFCQKHKNAPTKTCRVGTLWPV